MLKKQINKTDDTTLGDRWKLVSRFLERCKSFLDQGSATQYRSFLRERHQEIFEALPEAGTPYEIIKTRIGYFLQYRGFKNYGKEKELSKDFMINYNAAMLMRKDLKGYTPNTRSTMSVLIKSDGYSNIGGKIMAVKTQTLMKMMVTAILALAVM